MPQNMDITSDSRQAALAAKFDKAAGPSPTSPQLRAPKGEIRSIDLNEEVELDNDNPPEDTLTPKSRTNTEDGKPREVDLNPETDDTTSKDDGEPKGEGDDQVKFEELDGEDEPVISSKLKKEGEPNEDVSQDPADDVVPAGPRDYKSFPEPKLVPVLKALNNKQYKEMEPVLRDLVTKANKSKELEETLKKRPTVPSYQHESPDAYRISPEYRKLEEDAQYGEFEVNHWQEQILRIEQGLPWNRLDYDANGRPTFSAVPVPENGKIDVESKARINAHLMALAPNVAQIKANVNQFRQNYQASAKASSDLLEEISQRIFPTLKDLDKVTPEEKKWIEQTRQVIPDVFHGHPIVEKVLTRMAVFAQRQKNRLIKVMQENTALKAQLEDKEVAEPTKIPRGGGKSGTAATGKAFKYRDGRTIKADEVVEFED